MVYVVKSAEPIKIVSICECTKKKFNEDLLAKVVHPSHMSVQLRVSPNPPKSIHPGHRLFIFLFNTVVTNLVW